MQVKMPAALGAVEFLSHTPKTVLQKPGAQQACHVRELWP